MTRSRQGRPREVRRGPRASTWGLVAALAIGPAPAALAIDPAVPLRQLVVDSWGAKDGLPQNSATSIVQTADGYVWIATEEGLARFDGVRFEVFDHDRVPALGSSTVNVVREGRGGALWIGTTDALVRRDGERFRAWGVGEGLPKGDVWAVAEQEDGTAWVGSDGGGIAALRGGRLVPFTARDGLAGDGVHVLLAARDGSVWAGTSEGLTRLHGKEVTTYRVADGLPHAYVTSLWEGRGGDLWIGTNGGGLARLSGGRFRVYGERDGLAVPTVLSVREDRDGSVWAGTNGGGLCRLSGERFECLTAKDGLPGNLVFTLAEDREGGLWVGTNGEGIGRLREGSFLAYGKKEGLSSDVVLPVLEDEAGVLWTGTAGGGLNRIDVKSGKVTVFGLSDGLPHAVVLSLAKDRAGSLWIGTAGGGLTRLAGGRFVSLTTRDGLASNLVQSILVHRDGGVWAGTNGGGIGIVRGGRIATLRARDGLASDSVVSLLEARDGSVWVGTTAGLSHVVDGKASTVEAPALSGRTVLALLETADGALWAGTKGGGLVRLAGGRASAIRRKDGLLDDIVGALVEDAAGNIWMSCNKGVFRARRSELEEFAQGRRRSVESTAFGTRDGMRTAECNGGFTPSSWRASDGRLWFPTGRGLAVVDPARLRDDPLPPPVRIESVLSDGRALDLGMPVEVAAGSRNLEVRFTAPSFVAPDGLRFRYRLEGFDEEWVEAGMRRSAYFTKVPPGRYRFQVRACNGSGAWGPAGAALELSVAARFHQTWTFYGLCLAVAGAAALAGHRLRVRRTRDREAKEALARERLERAVEERTAQLTEANETLEAFSSSVSHDLRAPLRAIDGFTRMVLEEHSAPLAPEGKRLLGKVRDAAARMGRLIDDILRFSRVGRERLRRQEVDMAALARSAFDELAAADPGAPVDFRLEPLPAAIADAALLRQVWQNLLSNALKFTAPNSRRTVIVRGRREEGRLVYEVVDDGVGFDPAGASRMFGVFERLHGAAEFDGTGVGLSLVKRIVALHGGEVGARGAVGAGATIFFSIPDAPAQDPAAASAPPSRRPASGS